MFYFLSKPSTWYNESNWIFSSVLHLLRFNGIHIVESRTAKKNYDFFIQWMSSIIIIPLCILCYIRTLARNRQHRLLHNSFDIKISFHVVADRLQESIKENRNFCCCLMLAWKYTSTIKVLYQHTNTILK